MTAPLARRRLALIALFAGAAITAATGGVAYASSTDRFETVWATVVDGPGNPTDTSPADTSPVETNDPGSQNADGSWADCPEEADGSSGAGGSSGTGSDSGSNDQQGDV